MRANIGDRLRHITDAIDNIRVLLAGKTIELLERENAVRAAFERYLEIISEASRHIPSEMKEKFPLIPWTDIANIGNYLRHAYDGVDIVILWNIYVYELDALEAAIKSLASLSDKEAH
jgi:uncharacterized protein with HEPN domain